MKVCSTCKETKFFGMFSLNKATKDGYNYQCKACYKAHYEANKERLLEKQKAHYEANKERHAERSKAYRESNKEKIAEIRKSWQEANRERLTEYKKAYREANRENMKAYRKANRDRMTEYNSRHRARKRNAIPKFLRNCEVEKQRLRDIFKLRQLLSYVTGIEHHVDHMWPLSKGGPHWSGNLQILTATENLSKYDKLCKTLKKNIKASLEIARKEYVNDEDNSNRH